MQGITIKGLTAWLLLGYTMSAAADIYHYDNMLIGDRASGMGGAYTAISDDASGLYYNPAGIVFSEDLKLSASVNAYHTSNLEYKGVLSGGNWTRESSSLVPNFFGITRKLGDGYFGFSYAVTESVAENQDSVFRNFGIVDLFTVNINNRDDTTKIGPSYAIKLTDSLNLGATLYMHIRERETINNQWIRNNDSSFEWSNRYFETSETGINPILGLLWSPSDELSIGLSLRKTFILSSDTEQQVTLVTDTGNSDPVFTSSDEERELPLNIRIGVAYFPSNRFLLDVDLSYYEATSGFLSDAEETINLAAGIEYYVDSSWAVRGGIFTNNANTPEIRAGGVDQDDHVDLTGFSLSLSRFSKTSSVTAGFSISSGTGEAQVLSGTTAIQDLEIFTSTLFLSTSYQF
ncbi:MAG: hypothetical protein QNJ69_10890 [Gammaproteobacteria bacterium]|nr:hypothetical protein [Gammaproteobacteria bacterium]